jgi:hypothetical protein
MACHMPMHISWGIQGGSMTVILNKIYEQPTPGQPLGRLGVGYLHGMDW